MEELREDLYKAIDKYGLDYDKLAEINKSLHNEIIKCQKGA